VRVFADAGISDRDLSVPTRADKQQEKYVCLPIHQGEKEIKLVDKGTPNPLVAQWLSVSRPAEIESLSLDLFCVERNRHQIDSQNHRAEIPAGISMMYQERGQKPNMVNGGMVVTVDYKNQERKNIFFDIRKVEREDVIQGIGDTLANAAENLKRRLSDQTPKGVDERELLARIAIPLLEQQLNPNPQGQGKAGEGGQSVENFRQFVRAAGLEQELFPQSAQMGSQQQLGQQDQQQAKQAQAQKAQQDQQQAQQAQAQKAQQDQQQAQQAQAQKAQQDQQQAQQAQAQKAQQDQQQAQQAQAQKAQQDQQQAAAKAHQDKAKQEQQQADEHQKRAQQEQQQAQQAQAQAQNTQQSSATPAQSRGQAPQQRSPVAPRPNAAVPSASGV